VIRRAHVAHAAVLAAVHHAAFPLPEAWSASAMAGQLAMPGVFGLMDEAGGLVLARVAGDEAEILTLGVVAGQRRRGVARALLNAAHEQAAAAGAHVMFLEVSETNLAARELYAQFGYSYVGRRPKYYSDGADALILRLSLGRAAAIAG